MLRRDLPNRQEFIAFLRHIDSQVPVALEVHLILDNYGTHKTAQSRFVGPSPLMPSLPDARTRRRVTLAVDEWRGLRPVRGVTLVLIVSWYGQSGSSDGSFYVYIQLAAGSILQDVRYATKV